MREGERERVEEGRRTNNTAVLWRIVSTFKGQIGSSRRPVHHGGAREGVSLVQLSGQQRKVGRDQEQVTGKGRERVGGG